MFIIQPGENPGLQAYEKYPKFAYADIISSDFAFVKRVEMM